MIVDILEVMQLATAACAAPTSSEAHRWRATRNPPHFLCSSVRMRRCAAEPHVVRGLFIRPCPIVSAEGSLAQLRSEDDELRERYPQLRLCPV